MDKKDINESHEILTVMQSQLDKIIAESKSSNLDDIIYYQAIRKLIDFKLNENEVKEQFKKFTDIVVSMSELDFSRRMVVENSKDMFAFIGTSLNTLNEELEAKVVPKEFLDEIISNIMEVKPDFSVLTNTDGKIVLVSKNPESIIGHSRKDLDGKRIQNFFATNIHFHTNNGNLFKDHEIQIINPDKELISVFLTAVHLWNHKIANPSFLYMFKEKRG
jgi:hypothetical protein